ncbi:hypothetical protein [Flavihumibacter sp. CACIAM 22H1]|uniref:hypothetical protein n=1 Tax=Flavihumibacter sp. CACIAM 22H1 TaxID=1812911 RepID=UPI0007A8B175|nr:hypothetical protein [Flavihumibacter sp. CACIAM 22H1]KYP15358.1 MAG: hypothetical protein A1D16_15790 [Flavihumibacter sp. CACIAM 22H1]
MASLKESLINNLPLALTLITGVISYFIKRKYDMIDKKIEKKYDLFYSSRMDRFNDFFKNYSTCIESIKTISTTAVANGKIESEKLDRLIYYPLSNLHSSYLQLRVYLEEYEIPEFQKIVNRLDKINGAISRTYFNAEFNDRTSESSLFSKSINNYLKMRNQ